LKEPAARLRDEIVMSLNQIMIHTKIDEVRRLVVDEVEISELSSEQISEIRSPETKIRHAQTSIPGWPRCKSPETLDQFH
jgi:hypothetical protein